MQEPLVSICCICYNQEQYICQALDGFVMQQTNFPFEVVISDDCSKDGTRAVIAEYKEKYPDLIRDVSPEKNKGSMANWWYVQEQAKGKYTAICEGDDYWMDPLKLQKQVDYMDCHSEVGLCYTDYGKCSNVNAPYVYGAFDNGVAVPPKNFEEFLLCNSYIAPMTWMYRRDVWKELDLSWVRTDGTLVWALEFYMKSKVAYLPEVTAVYREHMGSASKPITEAGFMRQYGGVLHTELDFVERYRDQVPTDLEDRIRSKGYIDLLPHALLAEDKDFVEEVKNYFEGKGIYFPQLLSMAEELNKARAQAYHAWNSKAYKLGRAILDPIKTLRRK